MRLAVALVLNLLLVLGLGTWLRQEYRRTGPSLRRWLLPALALRMGVGLWQVSPDARFMNSWGQAISTQFWAQPSMSWRLWQSSQMRLEGHIVELYEWSNTLLVSKILGLLDFASLGTIWLNGLYLSVSCFVACWVLVRTLGKLFPAAPSGAGVVAFLLWPSVVWWTASITKEALLLGSGAALVALVLPKLYTSRALPPASQAKGSTAAPAGHLAQWLGWGLLVVGCAWLHLRLRYFYAVPLLGSLLALAGVVPAERRGWLRPQVGRLVLGLLGGLAVVAAVAVAVGGEAVSKDFITSQLWQNYNHGVATSSGRPHIVYESLQPTMGSMLRYAPLAAAQTLTRPWLGESWAALYVATALENLLLCGLVLLAALAFVRRRAGQLPSALVLALLLYCLVLVVLIGLSTPNLGTLHRYRAAMLPWLLWLLLQNDYARRLLRRLGMAN
jgi:hypothetical protein